MTRQIITLLVGLVLFSGCERSLKDSSTDLKDPDLQNLSNDLITDLNLSKSSADGLNRSLGRHYGKGPSHPPGFLWKVAADLQQTLSDEEKAALFDRLDQHNLDLFLYRYRWDQIIRNHTSIFQHELHFIQSILTDDQRETFTNILEVYRAQFTVLWDSLKSGSITRPYFQSQLAILRDALMAEIDAMLTDEQKAILEDKKAQFAANREQWRLHRQEQQEKIKQAMYEALQLTESQITEYEQILSDSKSAIQALRNQLKDGAIDMAGFQDSLRIVVEDRNTKVEALLTIKQLEIVKIHLFLEIRFIRWRHRMIQPLQNYGYNTIQPSSGLKIELV